MQVFIATVSLVTRDQFKELGVETMGEQALLLEACRQSEGCKSTIIICKPQNYNTTIMNNYDYTNKVILTVRIFQPWL